MKIIDAHSHLWYTQDTEWNGKRISPLPNGRAMFLGEERQMLPPFMTDGHNTAEVFLSNMDYAQVSAAVVVQEFIDGLQNDYLHEVSRRWPDRFKCFAMVDYLNDGFLAEASRLLLDDDAFIGMAIPGHRLLGRSLLSDEMMQLFHLMEDNGKLLSITLKDGDEQAAELSEVIEECPRLKIAIGHLCMADQPTTPPWDNPSWLMQVCLAMNEGVYLECGGITWLYNQEFYPYPSAIRALREAADMVGWEKLMWGSDYPRTVTAVTYRMTYDFITKSKEIAEQDKQLLLAENARRLYGFDRLVELPYVKNMSE